MGCRANCSSIILISTGWGHELLFHDYLLSSQLGFYHSILTSPEYKVLMNVLLLIPSSITVATSDPQSRILHQRFLPNLEIFEYTGKLDPPPRNYADLYSLPPVGKIN